MSIFLTGCAIQFFKGIGAEPVYLAPFQQFNFFVGANNSGKSTVLECLHRHAVDKATTLNPTEQHQGATTGQFAIGYAIEVERLVEAALSDIEPGNKDILRPLIQDVINRAFSRDGYVWAKRLNDTRRSGQYDFWSNIRDTDFRNTINDNDISRLWRAFNYNTYGSRPEQRASEVFGRLRAALSVQIPRIKLIPAKRHMQAGEADFSDFTGRGLINELAQLQNPDFNEAHKRQQFNRITSFLRVVTDRPDARIEIPHHRNHVNVHMDQKVLPLTNLGMGIHEVIMLATACTLHEQTVMCIEEPEAHLHPILQRKLVNYLRDNTENQYFIATHSPTFIDTPGAAIFHVINDGATTSISETIMRADKFRACRDLGVRASDIVQSNAAIWVEGPSDRIYLKWWLRAIAPELVEGVHFSIMFYGGRLLSHLQASDEELTEFIELRNLNRNLAIIMDSDKSGETDHINETKIRIQKEFSAGGSFAWITQGREIENYIDPTLIENALRECHRGTYLAPDSRGQFHHPLHFKKQATTKGGLPRKETEKAANKISVARYVTNQPCDLDIYDLRKCLTRLVEFIRKAND